MRLPLPLTTVLPGILAVALLCVAIGMLQQRDSQTVAMADLRRVSTQQQALEGARIALDQWRHDTSLQALKAQPEGDATAVSPSLRAAYDRYATDIAAVKAISPTLHAQLTRAGTEMLDMVRRSQGLKTAADSPRVTGLILRLASSSRVLEAELHRQWAVLQTPRDSSTALAPGWLPAVLAVAALWLAATAVVGWRKFKATSPQP